MEAFGNRCIAHSLALIEQQPQKYRGLLPSGRDTDVPPLNSRTDKTQHTQPAGCKASWNVEVFAVTWVQHHLDRNQRVLQAWASRDTGAVETEALGLRLAIPDADQDTIELHGGRETVDHSSHTGHHRYLEDRSSTPDVRRVEPHGCQLVDGFVPSRFVAIPLSTHPFTATKVHRNPIQNGRCNEGNRSAMECVSYLYQ